MKKIFILVIIIISISMLLSDEIDNILEVNGEKVYFSLNGYINSKYFNINSYRYGDIIRKYYNDNINSKKYDHNKTGSIINLPDSLSMDYIKVKKGYKAVKINSSNLEQFTIEGFKLTPDCFVSTPRVIMSLSDSLISNRKDLLLISQKSSTLKLMTSNSLVKIQEKEIYENLKGMITNFFIKNRNIYKHQMDYRNNHLDSLNNVELEEEIISKFDFQFYKIDDEIYFVNGKTFSDWDNPFVALIMPDDKKVVFKSTTRFLNSFTVQNTHYFYCVDFKSGSGVSVYQICKIKENKFEVIFNDGSYSN